MTTIIIVFVMLLLATGLIALYREVGIGRGTDSTPPVRPSFGTPLQRSPVATSSTWPFRNLAAGDNISGLLDDAFTGFLAICTDDEDPLGMLYSLAVVAEEWDYPLLIGVGTTIRPIGWTERLSGLPGDVDRHDMSSDEVSSLMPARLPVAVFMQEGQVREASIELESPSSIAYAFQRCRFGLTR